MIEAQVESAIESVRLANNGYADIGSDARVAARVEQAGLVVIRTTDLHGKAVFRGFTPRAQRALMASPFGQTTYSAPSKDLVIEVDTEGAILARQELDLVHYL